MHRCLDCPALITRGARCPLHERARQQERNQARGGQRLGLGAHPPAGPGPRRLAGADTRGHTPAHSRWTTSSLSLLAARATKRTFGPCAGNTTWRRRGRKGRLRKLQTLLAPGDPRPPLLAQPRNCGRGGEV